MDQIFMGFARIITTTSASALVCFALLLPGGVLKAAGNWEPARGQGVQQHRRNDYTPLGLRAGSFLFYPELELVGEYDSNIFRLPEDFEEDDFITHVKPSVSMNSNWNRHALNAYAGADLAWHDDHSSEDYTDYRLSADGRLDVLRDSAASGAIGYADLHEDRSSTDGRGGVEPTPYTQAYLNLGYQHRFNRMGVKLAYDTETLEYESVRGILGGVIYNGDRDRTRDEFSLRLSYQLRPQFDVFAEGSVNTVDYEDRFDAGGRERSSDGYKLIGGVSIDLTNLLEGDAYLGYLRQEYDDPLFDDISDPTLGFGLRWMPSGLTTFSANLDRKPQETTSPTASGYLSTIFSLGVDHELKRNILLDGVLSYTSNDYQQNVPGGKEEEDTLRAGLGVKYLFNRRFYAGAGYDYEKRTSDIAIQEYSLHQARVSVGARW